MFVDYYYHIKVNAIKLSIKLMNFMIVTLAYIILFCKYRYKKCSIKLLNISNIIF